MFSMKKKLVKHFFLSIGLIAFFSACQDQPPQFKNAIYITHINTIDGENGLQQDMTVVIEQDRIVKVEKSNDRPLDETSTIIDGTGKYLIPGLWDAHVHFAYLEDLAPSMFDLFLIHGITSVRDTGGKMKFVKKWKDLSMENPRDAPRVMIAGPLIDGTPNVYDGSTPGRPELSVGSASVEEIKALVQQLAEEGVDFLKAYEMLSPEQFYALMEMAKEKDLKVTGHIPLSMDAAMVSNAGIHSLEHLRNIEMSCVENAEELLGERQQMLADGQEEEGGILRTKIHQAQRAIAIQNENEAKTEEILNLLAKNQTWQVPTLGLHTLQTRKHVTREDWRETFQLLPDTMSKQWLAGSDGIKAMEKTAESILQANWAKNMVKKIHEKGIGIMAGTDCPIAYLTPGYSLHEELALLVESGLNPLEAIESATTMPATYFSMEDELGLIKEGFLADLVILENNPLDKIENSKSIEAIFKSGKYRSRADLDELIKDLRLN